MCIQRDITEMNFTDRYGLVFHKLTKR